MNDDLSQEEVNWHELLGDVIEERDMARAELERLQLNPLAIDKGELIEAIVIHLEELHCSQWGSSVGIVRQVDRYKLARHLAATLIMPVLERMK